MKKRFIAAILIGTLMIGMLSGCGNSPQENTGMMTESEETIDKEAEEASRVASEAAALEAAEEAAAKAAEEEADTYYEEGRTHLYGLHGYGTDLEAAHASFEKALELGKTEANFYLGVLYDWYGYPEKDFEMARAYYEAAGDDPYAWLSLGFLYYNGQGVEEDTEKAQELFEAVIAEGCMEGYFGRGIIAMADEDYDTALEYYNKVLEGGEQIYIAAAMYDIAYSYYSGEGVGQDYAKAMEWFEKSAGLGYSIAMDSIGYMYYSGEGVEQDDAKAIEWYEKSADLNDIYAMNNLGTYYLMIQKYAKALRWFEDAADLGNADAMDMIASMYENGAGVARNPEKAQEWRNKAEEARK